MNFKKLLCIVLSLTFCLAIVGCDKKPSNNGTASFSHQNPLGENDVQILEPDSGEHKFSLSSQNGGTIIYKCSHCDKEETVQISCVSGMQNAFKVDGTTISFTAVNQESIYDISGKLHGNIIIDVGNTAVFELELSGFEITSFLSCPITVLSGDKVALSAKKETKNYIYDTRNALEQINAETVSASVYAECDLSIQGKGSLYVKSVNNNGIQTKDDLTVKNLSLQVDCNDNALKGNDSVTIESGSLILISRMGDGIKTNNTNVSSKGKQRGTVTVSGGNVLIYSACDGIDSAYDVVINETLAGITLQVHTDKYSKYSSLKTAVVTNSYYVRHDSDAYTYSIKYSSDNGETVWRNSTEPIKQGLNNFYPIEKVNGCTKMQVFAYSKDQKQGQETSYAACSKVMSVNNFYDTLSLRTGGNEMSFGWTNYTAALNGKTVTNKTGLSTKGIKAQNNIIINSGVINIESYDDGLHAIKGAVLKNGSNSLGNITVSGGNITLYSNDDGLHADGKALVSGGRLEITGSYEGIDASEIGISGGEVIVKSTNESVNSSADLTITGGIVTGI